MPEQNRQREQSINIGSSIVLIKRFRDTGESLAETPCFRESRIAHETWKPIPKWRSDALDAYLCRPVVNPTRLK